ncbi:MAG: DsrE family protein [Acidobacteriota bacterium]|jgi:intracellular sulfur oxidation DsrE/DsrF family protein
MRTRKDAFKLITAAVLVLMAVSAAAQTAPEPVKKPKHIKVDVHARLKKADLVFDMADAKMMRRKPRGLVSMIGLARHFKKEKVPYRIVGVFYGRSGAWVLKDRAYDGLTGKKGGNPYKKMIARLRKLGVEIDVCAVWMGHKKLSNADLLEGVKVTNNAYLRIIQLQQDGYVKMVM